MKHMHSVPEPATALPAARPEPTEPQLAAPQPAHASIGIQVKQLRVVYDKFVAVADTSFTVHAGESFGIVGESGSGKSTVLRAICGLARVQAGTVLLQAGQGHGKAMAAQDLAHGVVESVHAPPELPWPPTLLPLPGSKAFRRTVQMVFQDPYGSLHPRQTVDRILAEPLAIYGVQDAQTRIEKALDEVGLGSGFRFRYPHQLSGGQRQRVAIARALILEPQILLLDEPTSALDASVQAEVLNLLQALRRRRGLTFIMVSHDLAVVTHLCEHLMVMQRGKTVEMLSSANLAANQASDPYTLSLMQACEGFQRVAP